MGITRRELLMRVGQAGGYAAAFTTMQTLGLLPIPQAEAVTWNSSPVVGKGIRVVILGGGIAGLVSAYEMGKLGYSCTVLEARTRPGGRNWTVRNGTTIEFTDGTKQTAAWQPDSYFNAGPARLPSTHLTMLGYCRELGVPLEVEVNSSRSALMVNDKAFGGKAIQQREAINDTRGHVSELLAKCIQQNALNQELSAGGQRAHADLSAHLRRPQERLHLQRLRSRRCAALARRRQHNRGNKAAARYGLVTRRELLGRHDV